MARLPIPEGTGRERSRLLAAHRPRVGEALNGLSKALADDVEISVREREALRMRIALANNCHT